MCEVMNQPPGNRKQNVQRVPSTQRARDSVVSSSVKSKMGRLVYIMGYGRSGSTLLDILLGSHPDIQSVGELVYFDRWRREGLSCSCGKRLDECDFWRRVQEQYAGPNLDAHGRIGEAVERRSRLPSLLLELLPAQLLQDYRESRRCLLEAIAEVSGKRVVVDSSKSAGRAMGRALALEDLTEADVKILFLVRDSRAVAWSTMRGPATEEFKYAGGSKFKLALRASGSWALTNAVCLWLTRRFDSKNVCLVRYEDLVTDPARELLRIGQSIDVDLEPVILAVRDGEPVQVGHNIGGNRLRFDSGIVIREDAEWMDKMPERLKRLTWTLTGLVARKFGYRSSGELGERPEIV